jgi:hypothetical protein
MSYYDYGNPSVNSTNAAFVADPSTATLVAELDSTQLGTQHFATQQTRDYRITVILGSNASTNAAWLVEHAISTGLGSTALVTQFGAFSPAGQSAQYVWQWRLQQNSRIRCRVNSSLSGLVSANLQAEPLT